MWIARPTRRQFELTSADRRRVGSAQRSSAAQRTPTGAPTCRWSCRGTTASRCASLVDRVGDDDVQPGAVDKRGDDLERWEEGDPQDDQRTRRVIVPRLDQCGEDEHRVASWSIAGPAADSNARWVFIRFCRTGVIAWQFGHNECRCTGMTSPKLDIIVIFVVIVFSVWHCLSASGNDVDLRRFSLHLLQWTFAYPRTHCIAKYSAHPVTSLTELYRTLPISWL